MAIYFCFSDECGSYSNGMTINQLKAHPYYVRAVIMIDAAEWSILNQRFKQIKKKYQIPIDREFKWAYLWSMTKKDSAHDDENLCYFKHQENKDRFFSYVEKVMQLANELSFKRVILTYSVNSSEHHKEFNLLKFHFQDILRRIEMEIQSGDNLAVLFIDPVNSDKDEKYRNLYMYRERTAMCSVQNSEKWRNATHLPLSTVDDIIRDADGRVLLSIEELQKHKPDKHPDDNTNIYCFEDAYVKNEYWGLMKIDEIMFEREYSKDEQTYSIDAGRFVRAILADALGGEKMVVM